MADERCGHEGFSLGGQSHAAKRRLFFIFAFSFIAFLADASPVFARPADTTLARVKAAGRVRCGVVEMGTSLTSRAADGRWVGFYPDFCRALAAATTGAGENVDFVSVSQFNRFDAVSRGVVDVLMSSTTWTFGRDVDLSVAFPALYLFDGQSFMVHASDAIRAIEDLRKRSVCVAKGSTALPQLEELSRIRGLDFKIVTHESVQGAYASFFSRECQAMMDDSIGLVSERATFSSETSKYVLLGEMLTKEPLSPVVRKGDEAWESVVRWVVFATIGAEEMGVTQANADEKLASADPRVRRLLGVDSASNGGLGLDPRWAYRVVKAVGNYGEIFDRNLGSGSPMKLPRGRNALWSQGGLIWSPPFQ